MAADLIVVGSGAIGVVRRVGPMSWTVLTALAIDAAASGEVTVRTSVRSLAADLGSNKDTVARRSSGSVASVSSSRWRAGSSRARIG